MYCLNQERNLTKPRNIATLLLMKHSKLKTSNFTGGRNLQFN